MLTLEQNCTFLSNYTLIWHKYDSEDTRFVGLGFCAVQPVHCSQNCWFVADNDQNYLDSNMILYFFKVLCCLAAYEHVNFQICGNSLVFLWCGISLHDWVQSGFPVVWSNICK